MARLIDADALKEFIDDCGICAICPQKAPRCSYDCDFPDFVTEKWNVAIDAQPTIDAVSEWIPCSERLPSEYEEVLVCDKDGTMEVCDLETFGRSVGLKWTDKNGYECWLDVIAWMPLPKPYGERKESE